jgi:hypothetical protein
VRRCGGAAARRALRLRGVQHPDECSAERALVLAWDNTGLSALLIFLSGALDVATALGKALVRRPSAALAGPAPRSRAA